MGINLGGWIHVHLSKWTERPSRVAKLGEITGKTRVLYSKLGEITGKTRVLPGGLIYSDVPQAHPALVKRVQ